MVGFGLTSNSTLQNIFQHCSAAATLPTYLEVRPSRSLSQIHLTLGTIAMLAGSFLEECGEQVVRPLLAEGGGSRDAMEIIVNKMEAAEKTDEKDLLLEASGGGFPNKLARKEGMTDPATMARIGRLLELNIEPAL